MATVPVHISKGLHAILDSKATEKNHSVQQQGWHPQFLEKARCLHQELIHLNTKLDTTFLEMGMVLKEIRDRQLYQPLNYKNFNAYLKELDFSRSRAYALIGVVEDFYLTGQINQHELVSIGWEKLSLLRPIKETQSFSEWVEKAIDLSKRQLRQALINSGLLPSRTQVAKSKPIAETSQLDAQMTIIPPQTDTQDEEPVYYLAVKKIQAVKVLSEEELEQAKASGVYPLIVGVVGSAYAKFTSLGLPTLTKKNGHLPTLAESSDHEPCSEE